LIMCMLQNPSPIPSTINLLEDKYSNLFLVYILYL
jgi:hypothetical protein